MKVTQDVVLLYGVVNQDTASPIDIEIGVLEHIVMQSPYEISTVVQPIDINIIDQPRGTEYDE